MDGVCAFCRRDGVTGKIAGDLITKEGLTMHESCLYFSAGLAQRVAPEKGILGFLKEDIEKELRRGRRGKCVVCRKTGNFVGCAVSHCPRAGHFPCLHANNYLFQYYGTFNTYCPAHCPSQKPCPLSSKKPKPLSSQCCVCFTKLKPKSVPSFQILYTPCCFNLIHRKCVQSQAWSAGEHFFRCPVCNDTDQFIPEMLRLGIEIPSRDASWETTGQFDDLHLQEEKCGLEQCVCPKGRRSFTSSGSNRFMYCCFCGQCLGHHDCLMKVVAMETTNIREHRGCYVCEDCSPVLSIAQETEIDKTESMQEVDERKSREERHLPQMQQVLLLSDKTAPEDKGNYEVVDLTTPSSSPESCTNRLTWPSPATSFPTSANSTNRAESNSAQLTAAPLTGQLRLCQAENYTITLCSCMECTGAALSPKTSPAVATGNGNHRDRDTAVVEQLVVSILTSKLPSIRKRKQKKRRISRKRSRGLLT